MPTLAHVDFARTGRRLAVFGDSPSVITPETSAQSPFLLHADVQFAFMNINRFSSILQVMTVASHTFLPCIVPDQPVILDLGANRGEFQQGLRFYFRPSRYVAVEPNPELSGALTANRDLELFPVAIAEVTGPTRFNLEENIESSHIATQNGSNTVVVAGRTLPDLIDEANLQRIDLLKVDIEGAECKMLTGLSSSMLRNISQITVEFHDFCGLNTAAKLLTQ